MAADVVSDERTDALRDEGTEAVPDERTEALRAEGTEAVPDELPDEGTEAVPDERTEALPDEVARRTAAGPLLAVCGLCGGAGASTLAYLVAQDAARATERGVLVCDTGGPTAGLATYARVESPRSLLRAAEAVATHEPLADGLFAHAEGGLRVIASAPRLEREADEQAVASLLGDARAAHELTVVDCGTLQGPADATVLAAATHVAWVLPATVGGVLRARHMLDAIAPDPERPQLVVARRDGDARRPPTDELKALADALRAPLVLMPHVDDLALRPLGQGLDAAELTLQAIRGALGR